MHVSIIPMCNLTINGNGNFLFAYKISITSDHVSSWERVHNIKQVRLAAAGFNCKETAEWWQVESFFVYSWLQKKRPENPIKSKIWRAQTSPRRATTRIPSVLYIYYICLPDSHPDVEAQQVADHSRHGGQDDDPSDVVDQRVHSQTQQAERSIQLLEQVRVT